MSEIISIVDESDEVIGQVERAKFDKTTGKIYRTVSLFLFDSNGKILIQKRAKNKDRYADLWDLSSVAGHVLAGESYIDAIKRETLEEIGLKINNFFEIKKEFSKSFDGRRRFNMVFMAVEDFSLEDLKIQDEELSEVRILAIPELKEMIDSGENFADYVHPKEMSFRISEIAKIFEKL